MPLLMHTRLFFISILFSHLPPPSPFHLGFHCRLQATSPQVKCVKLENECRLEDSGNSNSTRHLGSRTVSLWRLTKWTTTLSGSMCTTMWVSHKCQAPPIKTSHWPSLLKRQQSDNHIGWFVDHLYFFCMTTFFLEILYNDTNMVKLINGYH